MIVKFHSSTNWFKKVGPLESFCSTLFSRGVLIFSGSIDSGKFIKAMGDSFIDYYFMLSTLYRDEDGIVCSKYINGDEVEVLEIEERSENSFEGIELDDLLPNKTINVWQKMGFAQDYSDSELIPKFKMGAFKLTIINGYFSIGYNLNHTIFDQGSIVYYFKYLAHLYTFGSEISLKKPQIIDVESLGIKIPEFKDINEAREYGGEALGYVYKPLSSMANNTQSPSIPKSLLQIKFNLNEIDKLKSSFSGQYLSRNDIMSSILLKVYNLNSNDERFLFGYVSNIRKSFGIGEEGVSNLINQCRMLVSVKDIKEMSIGELAMVNRKHVSQSSNEEFLKFVSWCKALKDNKEKMIEYFNPPPFNMTRASNWNGFDYDSIKFDNSSSPISLKHYQAAQWGINVISFSTDSSNSKYYTTQIYIPTNSLNHLQQFSEDSKLFSIDESYNLK